jgi:hypothetical protein
VAHCMTGRVLVIILICESLQLMWLEICAPFVLAQLACLLATMKIVLRSHSKAKLQAQTHITCRGRGRSDQEADPSDELQRLRDELRRVQGALAQEQHRRRLVEEERDQFAGQYVDYYIALKKTSKKLTALRRVFQQVETTSSSDSEDW